VVAEVHRVEKVPNFWKAEGVFLEGAGPEPAGCAAQTSLMLRRRRGEADVRARVERMVEVREVKCMVVGESRWVMDLWMMVEVVRGRVSSKTEKRMYVVVKSVMLCKRGVPLAQWVGKKES